MHSIHPKSSTETVAVQKILKPLFEYYKQRELLLAELLYEKGTTYTEIAEKLGVTPQAVRLTYPKPKQEITREQ